MCFGWIDSTFRNINEKCIQRFSPIGKHSEWTELNKERCKLFDKLGKLTKKVELCYKNEFKISDRMFEIIKSDKNVERNFYLFPEIYRRLRIDSTQRHFLYKNLKDIRERQITNFIKQTKLGRMYGNLSDYGRLF